MKKFIKPASAIMLFIVVGFSIATLALYNSTDDRTYADYIVDSYITLSAVTIGAIVLGFVFNWVMKQSPDYYKMNK